MLDSVLKDKHLHTIFGITLMSVLGVSSLMPVFPFIAASLGVDEGSIGIIITVFTIPGMLITPIAGVLADRFGRKVVLLPALFLFGVAGTACFFAPSLHVLLVLRFLQGMGAAVFSALAQALVGDFYEGKQRNKVMGYNSSMLSFGTAFFPLLGGVLAILTPFMPFLLALIAVPVAVAVYRTPFKSTCKQEPIKVYLQKFWKVAHSRQMLCILLIVLCAFLQLYGAIAMAFPTFAKKEFLATPFQIGLIISIASLGTGCVAWQLGKLVDRFPAPAIALCGTLLYMVAMYWLPRVSSLYEALIPIFIFGLGQGAVLPTTALMATSLAPAQQRGAVMALYSWTLRIAQTLAPVVFYFAYARKNIFSIYYVALGLDVLACIVCLVLLRLYTGTLVLEKRMS